MRGKNSHFPHRTLLCWFGTNWLWDTFFFKCKAGVEMKSFHSVSSAAGSRALLYVFFLEGVWKQASLLSPRGSGECKEPSKDKDSPKIKLHYQLFGAMFTRRQVEASPNQNQIYSQINSSRGVGNKFVRLCSKSNTWCKMLHILQGWVLQNDSRALSRQLWSSKCQVSDWRKPEESTSSVFFWMNPLNYCIKNPYMKRSLPPQCTAAKRRQELPHGPKNLTRTGLTHAWFDALCRDGVLE